MPAARTAAATLAAAAALIGAGCGNDDRPSSLPPAAGPACSPALADEPAGRVVDLGARAEGIAVDPETGTVAVATSGPDELVLLDARTLRERRRVPLPGPARHVRLARSGGAVFVPAGDRVLAVALRGRAALAEPAGGPVHDVVPDEPPRALAEHTAATLLDDGRAALVAGRGRTITLGDLTEPAGIGPTHVVAGDDGRLYVADTDGDGVLLFRSRPELGLVRRAAVPGGAPYGTAIDRERGKLWVTATATNEAVQLTADGAPRIQRRFPTVRQPNSIAVDDRTGRVFVVSAADGSLQAFDGYPPATLDGG